MIKLSKIIFIALFSVVLTASTQTQIIGSKDYALASSSIMWMPRGSSVFINPAELGRIHQDEFLFNTSRFRRLSSMTATFAFPFAGSFAGGIASQDSLTHYTLGYGRLLGKYHTIGTSVSIVSPIQDGFRFAFGTAFHIPFSSQRSGIHTGISISNLPKKSELSGGIALWAVPERLRLQVATQNRVVKDVKYGAEFIASDNISILAGTTKFKSIYGGVSLKTSNFIADIAAGPAGLSFTLNIVIGESAEDQNTLSYEDGYNLYSEKRFSEAYRKFLMALEYDEYDDDSRTMAENSLATLDSVETTNLVLGKYFEDNFDYVSAADAYSMILRANPSNIEAETLLINSRRKIGEFVSLLIVVGDSLKSRRNILGARKNYEQALKYDPGNDMASSRLDELENLSRENVRNILIRAQSMLSKKQYDYAQKEYERVLSIEPKNSRAKAGLNTIERKRKEEQFEIAKARFDEGKYYDALLMMLELSKQNIKAKEAQNYIDDARKKLMPEVEKKFKLGLSYYVNENYDHAINIWDYALQIQPRHAGMLEYRKRAEEKMKALEKLK